MKITRSRPASFASLALVALATLAALTAASAEAPAASEAPGAHASSVERGRYLMRAGDCESCHTAPGGKDLAGGFPIPTPFGVIYSKNITSDPDTGIGKWTKDQFYDAMHRGVDDEGKHLYPAFPYPWFTKLSRADVDALRDYLATVPPVKQRNKAPELRWPLGWRPLMAGWNLLFFHEGELKPNPAKSPEWNRGAYLVEGAGHCGACHTPKNSLGAVKKGEALQGGDAGERWFAPSLTGDLRDGIGDWSVAEIVEYLKTGSNARSATAGTMTDVIKNSTQYLSDADLKSIAIYLKDIPAPKGEPKTPALAGDSIARGEALYLDNCTGCHMPDGGGVAKVFPPLKLSAAIQASEPGTVLHVVLGGEQMAAPKTRPTGLTMPGFRDKMNDQQIADVVNYMRNAWGNRGSTVDAATVAAVRKAAIESPQGDPGRVRAELLICRSNGPPAGCRPGTAASAAAAASSSTAAATTITTASRR
jgi:mono/diheme cytochrome c family protein